MAAYDQPGFRGATPSSPEGFDQRSGTAPGTNGASGTAADNVTGVEVTPPTGTWWDRAATATSGTVMPDQVAGSPISPGPQSDYVSTGAGEGNADPYRHPAQEG